MTHTVLQDGSSPAPVRLWHHSTSPHARAARLVLMESSLPFDLIEEKPWEWRPEFTAINPAGEVPVTLLPDGMLIVGLSALVEFIAEEPTQPPRTIRTIPLLPATRPARAEARRLLDWFDRKFQADVTGGLVYEKLLARLMGVPHPTPDAALIRDLNDNLRYHLSYIGHLVRQSRWLVGDDMTVADLMAAAQISTVDYLGEIDWAAVPHVKRWYQQIKSRPSMRALLADRWPGLPPSEAYSRLDF